MFSIELTRGYTIQNALHVCMVLANIETLDWNITREPTLTSTTPTPLREHAAHTSRLMLLIHCPRRDSPDPANPSRSTQRTQVCL